MNRELMKEFLKEAFPNPERKGCPDENTLQALAEDRLKPNDQTLHHVGSCSDCYKEYLHFRQDFDEMPTREQGLHFPATTSVSPVVRKAAVLPFPGVLSLSDHETKDEK